MTYAQPTSQVVSSTSTTSSLAALRKFRCHNNRGRMWSAVLPWNNLEDVHFPVGGWRPPPVETVSSVSTVQNWRSSWNHSSLHVTTCHSPWIRCSEEKFLKLPKTIWEAGRSSVFAVLVGIPWWDWYRLMTSTDDWDIKSKSVVKQNSLQWFRTGVVYYARALVHMVHWYIIIYHNIDLCYILGRLRLHSLEHIRSFKLSQQLLLVPEDFTRPHTLIGTFLSITTVTRSKEIEVSHQESNIFRKTICSMIQGMFQNVSKANWTKQSNRSLQNAPVWEMHVTPPMVAWVENG